METIKDELLEFWFGKEPDDAAVAQAKAGLWWGRDPATDELLQERFGAATSAAAAGVLDHWTGSPRGRLALILLLDQLPRAIHRGTPTAFATDGMALEAASRGLASGADRLLRPIERVFFYLPFEHSERIEDQERSVELFRGLLASTAESSRASFEFFLDYAVRHRDIIARFGRFPHRNLVLGRQSTAMELEFLEQPDSSF
jgi:uncharacterized protein (DUF924 family)